LLSLDNGMSGELNAMFEPDKERRAAIVLIGGRSRRMGTCKALLPFGSETALCRVLRILEPMVQRRIVVAAADQLLPTLPADVIVARDARPDCGPLEGIRAGMEAGIARAHSFFVCACDTPLLKLPFVRALWQLLDDDVDAVVPRDDQRFHPLSAVYHGRVLCDIEELLIANRLRPHDLVLRVRTRAVPVDHLRQVDPQLDSLRNLNTPADYRDALLSGGIAITSTVLASLPKYQSS
jgi:molybdopterin-guanine dinucleotide biosynthesis protein A